MGREGEWRRGSEKALCIADWQVKVPCDGEEEERLRMWGPDARSRGPLPREKGAGLPERQLVPLAPTNNNIPRDVDAGKRSCMRRPLDKCMPRHSGCVISTVKHLHVPHFLDCSMLQC